MLNITECRSYLDEDFSKTISDQELLEVRDQMQMISEVLVAHAVGLPG